MFQRMQDRFQKNLNKSKNEKRVTVPKSPDFQPVKARVLTREYVNEGKPPKPGQNAASQSVISKAAGGDKLHATLANKTMKSATSSKNANVKPPSSTKSDALRAQYTRDQLEKRNAEKAKKEQEDKERFDRQNRVSTYSICLTQFSTIVQGSCPEHAQEHRLQRQRGRR